MAQHTKKPPPVLRGIVAVALREAREGHRPKLRLTQQHLNDIPDEVFALTDLESLDLTGNNLRSIPERLWDLPKLRRVTLVGNPIEFLPNRPGLIIDLATYRRCRTQIDARNLNLFIGVDVSQEDADFWTTELKTITDLRELTVGRPTYTVGASYPKPSRAIQNILDALGNLDSLESLSLAGLQLGFVP